MHVRSQPRQSRESVEHGPGAGDEARRSAPGTDGGGVRRVQSGPDGRPCRAATAANSAHKCIPRYRRTVTINKPITSNDTRARAAHPRDRTQPPRRARQRTRRDGAIRRGVPPLARVPPRNKEDHADAPACPAWESTVRKQGSATPSPTRGRPRSSTPGPSHASQEP